MKFALLITVIIANIISIAQCACSVRALFADLNHRSYNISPSNYDQCTFYIKPDVYYDGLQHYLEIAWYPSDFDVRGNMPFCLEDYVEVFLTG